METTLQGSQELPANMSDSQSSEVTYGQLEIILEPDVTVWQELRETELDALPSGKTQKGLFFPTLQKAFLQPFS